MSQRILFVRAYPRETQEMVFDAHNRADRAPGTRNGRGLLDGACIFANAKPLIGAWRGYSSFRTRIISL